MSDQAATLDAKATGFEMPKLTLNRVLDLAKTRQGTLSLVLTALLLTSFWPWISTLPHEWFKPESYVQHGVLVPFASLYIAWFQWRKFRDTTEIRPTYAPAILLLPLTLINSVTYRSGFFTLSAILLLASIFVCVWTAMGGKWAIRMTPAIGFLSFTFTIWGEYIDQFTLSAQQLSAKLAFKMLDLAGLQPKTAPDAPSIIYLPRYDMDVGAACSGLKLTLAIITCAVFIALIDRLAWWKNAVILAVVVPIAMIINSIRIATIGLAGEYGGEQSGTMMHDFGAYAVMLLAFWLLYRIALALGWKI